MTPAYDLSALAAADIREIWEYVARDNPRAADRVADAFHRRFALLAMQPLLGEQCDDLAPGLRRFVVGNYAAYYVVVAERVVVARVLHGAQDTDLVDWQS